MKNIDEIRAAFPALDREISGRPVAYFDGPGGTQVPQSVVDAMSDYLLHHNANTHWNYETSRETDALLEASRQILADFLNCDIHEVVFGPNMTSLTFHLARSLGRGFSPGDEIIVTDLDHQANVAPWKALARDFGMQIRTVPMMPGGLLDVNRLNEAISPRTRLVAVGAASNALGTITDLRPIIDRCRESNCLTFVDAVHFAPHELVDFAGLGCDFLACSPYKFYGPHLGVIAGRLELLSGLEVPRLAPAPDTAPERLETGTLSHEAICGAAAAVDFLASIGDGDTRRKKLLSAYSMLHERGSSLLRRLWDGLHTLHGVQMYGPGPGHPRTPTVAFTVDGIASSDIAAGLSDDHAVFVSHGDFYASEVVETLGLQPEGLVRAGCACYTTESEVDRLIEGVASLAR